MNQIKKKFSWQALSDFFSSKSSVRHKILTYACMMMMKKSVTSKKTTWNMREKTYRKKRHFSWNCHDIFLTHLTPTTGTWTITCGSIFFRIFFEVILRPKSYVTIFSFKSLEWMCLLRCQQWNYDDDENDVDMWLDSGEIS